MWNYISRKTYNLFYRIKNLVYWFPVIWNDRNWDQYFYFTIMRHKLIAMRDFFNDDTKTMAVGNEIRAKEMDLCIKLLNRILKDEYEENAFMWHDKKWGDIVMNLDNGKVNIYRPKAITENEKEQELKEAKRLWNHTDNMKKQDIEYLHKIVTKYIQGWWD